MFQHSKIPAEWHHKWRQGSLPRIEYVQGLMYTAQFTTPEEALEALDPEEVAYFTQKVAYAAATPDDAEFTKIGNPAECRPIDARKLLAHIKQLGWPIPQLVYYDDDGLPIDTATPQE